MNSRELHRGKRKDNGEWVEGYLLRPNPQVCRASEVNECVIGYQVSLLEGYRFYEVYPETVGECTGLDTVSEQRIWEGDIVQHNETKYVVQRECDTPGGYWAETGFILKEIGSCDYISFVDTIDEYSNEICVRILGNIHDDYDPQ